MINKLYDVECVVVRIGNMDFKKGRYQQIRDFLNVDIAWDGKNQLYGTEYKWRMKKGQSHK